LSNDRREKTMKKQLALFALMVIINGNNAMEPESQEIISDLKELASALENNNILAIDAYFQKLPIAFNKISKFYEMDKILQQAFAAASPATKNAYRAIRQIATVKHRLSQKYPLASAKEISERALKELVKKGLEALPALKWLLEHEHVKDSGTALEIAIDDGFYQAAVLLVSHGSIITGYAKELAHLNANIPPIDDRYEKLLKDFEENQPKREL
jgi:hypothetical protein